jgi:TPR repeat protein
MYPTDLEAHLESYGGWTDLSDTNSDTSFLTPAKVTVSESNLEDAHVRVQAAESGERFWIHVIRYEPESGSIWGLVANELIQTDLAPWQPVHFHVFSVWAVIPPGEIEGLSEGEGLVYMVDADHAPNEPPPQDWKYEGDVSDGKWHGHGTLAEPDGRVYVGEFRDGLRHGHGKQTFGDDGSYVGQFKAGEPHGPGTRTLADGTKINYEYREGIIVSSDGPLDFGTDGLVEFQVGIESEKDDSPEMAFKWFRRSAELGCEMGEYAVARAYLAGDGVEKDVEQGIEQLREMADRGNPLVQVDLGMIYATGDEVDQNFEEAVRLFRTAADQGDSDGKFYLSRCYETGDGIEQDLEAAFKWTLEAAEEGHIQAQYCLGIALWRGQGVEANKEDGISWLRTAAEGGDVYAQFDLWFFLEDKEEGTKWLIAAAEQGHLEAQERLTDEYVAGYLNGKEHETEAVKWYRIGAERGEAFCQHLLAGCYQFGQGIEKDHKEAVKWYTRAAEAGHLDSHHSLAMCYQHGIGVEKNFDTAVKWFRSTIDRVEASGGDQDWLIEEANFEIAWGNRDWRIQGDDAMQASIDWIRSGVEQGSTEAMYALGMCYSVGRPHDEDDVDDEDDDAADEDDIERWGEAVDRDDLKALALFYDAAKLGHEEAKREFSRAVVEYLWVEDAFSFEDAPLWLKYLRFVRDLAEEEESAAREQWDGAEFMYALHDEPGAWDDDDDDDTNHIGWARMMRRAVWWWDFDSKYEGEVSESGLPAGEGVCIAGFLKYHGEWKEGLPYGEGKFTDYQWEEYVGQFKYGLYHGQGTLEFMPDDCTEWKRTGEFRYGEFWQGSEFNTDEDEVATYSGGVRREK